MRNESFVLFTKIVDVVSILTNEQKGILFQTILDYQNTGDVPEGLDPVVKVAFLPIKHDMDVCTANREASLEKRREAGRKSAEKRNASNANDSTAKVSNVQQCSVMLNDAQQCSTSVSDVQHNVNVNVNGNVNVKDKNLKERLVPKRSERTQRPASVEEVEQYMQTMQNGPANPSQTASAFYDYFESNGWKVGGKAPMKDWQAAARNWCRNEKTFRQPQGQKPMTRFHNFEQRPETDLDAEMLELSRKALGI